MKHLLVIDDDRDVCEMLALAGEKDGSIKVACVADSTEALTLLGEDGRHIDGILLDLSMYPTDGITLSEQIRILEQVEQRKPYRIAFHSGHERDVVIDSVMKETGVERFFPKPIDPFELLSEVKHWLDEPKYAERGS